MTSLYRTRISFRSHKIRPNSNIDVIRKSSCVNARGIPTAAYQVLHLLTEVGYPPPRSDGMGRYLRRGTPHQGIPRRGTPHPGLKGGTQGGVPPSGLPPPPAEPGSGTPPWLDLAQVPPPLDVDRLKTLPSLILRMRSVKINFWSWALYTVRVNQNVRKKFLSFQHKWQIMFWEYCLWTSV